MARYYIHGDRSDNDAHLYYCALCDLFEPEAHFSAHGSKNRERLDFARSQLKGLRPPAWRPEHAASLGDSWPKRSTPVKSPFFRWLARQCDRDDPIGDLARDAADDSNFPSQLGSLTSLEKHIASRGGHDVALTALREAFAEFRPRSTTRAPISAKLRFEVFRECEYRCQICGRKAAIDCRLEVDHKIAVARGGSSERDNLWVLCFTCNRGKGTREL